jgi:hypothetical protein
MTVLWRTPRNQTDGMKAFRAGFAVVGKHMAVVHLANPSRIPQKCAPL